MGRKEQPRRAGAKRRRLSPDERRREFVAKATEFFSEEGFGGGTRALARRLGETQSLLYRYFPSKEDLIKEVYRTVYLDSLETGWEKLLTERSWPPRDRLLEFYRAGALWWWRVELTDYIASISARYQSPISLAVIRATSSWPIT